MPLVLQAMQCRSYALLEKIPENDRVFLPEKTVAALEKAAQNAVQEKAAQDAPAQAPQDLPTKSEQADEPAQDKESALWWLKAVLEDLEKEGPPPPELANQAVPADSGEPRPKLRKLKPFKL